MAQRPAPGGTSPGSSAQSLVQRRRSTISAWRLTSLLPPDTMHATGPRGTWPRVRPRPWHAGRLGDDALGRGTGRASRAHGTLGDRDHLVDQVAHHRVGGGPTGRPPRRPRTCRPRAGRRAAGEDDGHAGGSQRLSAHDARDVVARSHRRCRDRPPPPTGTTAVPSGPGPARRARRRRCPGRRWCGGSSKGCTYTPVRSLSAGCSARLVVGAADDDRLDQRAERGGALALLAGVLAGRNTLPAMPACCSEGQALPVVAGAGAHDAACPPAALG